MIKGKVNKLPVSACDLSAEINRMMFNDKIWRPATFIKDIPCLSSARTAFAHISGKKINLCVSTFSYSYFPFMEKCRAIVLCLRYARQTYFCGCESLERKFLEEGAMEKAIYGISFRITAYPDRCLKDEYSCVFSRKGKKVWTFKI